MATKNPRLSRKEQPGVVAPTREEAEAGEPRVTELTRTAEQDTVSKNRQRREERRGRARGLSLSLNSSSPIRVTGRYCTELHVAEAASAASQRTKA